jgi:hypothetical protein
MRSDGVGGRAGFVDIMEEGRNCKGIGVDTQVKEITWKA